MGRKIIGILVGMLFILTTMVSVVSAKQDRTMYGGCYIKASGEISERDWFAIIRLPNMWKILWFRSPFNEQKAFISLWRIVYDSNSIIKIYTKLNGKLLWEQNGKQDVNLVIVWFDGVYIPKTTVDGRVHVEISGNAMFIKEKYIKK
jgi:hypothetical protein